MGVPVAASEVGHPFDSCISLTPRCERPVALMSAAAPPVISEARVWGALRTLLDRASSRGVLGAAWSSWAKIVAEQRQLRRDAFFDAMGGQLQAAQGLCSFLLEDRCHGRQAFLEAAFQSWHREVKQLRRRRLWLHAANQANRWCEAEALWRFWAAWQSVVPSSSPSLGKRNGTDAPSIEIKACRWKWSCADDGSGGGTPVVDDSSDATTASGTATISEEIDALTVDVVDGKRADSLQRDRYALLKTDGEFVHRARARSASLGQSPRRVPTASRAAIRSEQDLAQLADCILPGLSHGESLPFAATSPRQGGPDGHHSWHVASLSPLPSSPTPPFLLAAVASSQPLGKTVSQVSGAVPSGRLSAGGAASPTRTETSTEDIGSAATTKPRGPERFFYDTATYTGCARYGGPTVIDRPAFSRCRGRPSTGGAGGGGVTSSATVIGTSGAGANARRSLGGRKLPM